MTLRAREPDAGARPAGPGSKAAVTWPVAKVNLTLRVGARRPDGFHEVATVLQAIDLADRLTVEVGTEGGGVEIEVEGADLGPPADNLCIRAAETFRQATGWDVGVRIHLIKAIPAGAGLGGGSSDAAATLRALDALAGRPLSAEALTDLAGELGSDVPFFLGPSTLAAACGRGESLEALAPLTPAALVLVFPPVHVSTADAYRALDEVRAGAPARAEDVMDVPPPTSWRRVTELAVNDFEEAVPSLYPDVGRALAALRASGAHHALLCGSGGASFGVFESWAKAESAAEALHGTLGVAAVAVRTLKAFPAVLDVAP